MNNDWWVYMIECTGGGIYVGISSDVENRFKQHEKGKGALYTRLNKPLRLIGKIKFPTRQEAIQAEAMYKKMNRSEKLKWVHTFALSNHQK